MSAPTPGFWAHAASAATPGGPGSAATPWPAGGDDLWGSTANRAAPGRGGMAGGVGANGDGSFGQLDENWLSTPGLATYFKRLKVTIEGTVHGQYLAGEFEGRIGRIVDTQTAAEGFSSEQNVLVKFAAGGGKPAEEKLFLAKYIRPVKHPRMGEEVVVLPGVGGSGGVTLSVVREPAEDDKMPIVVSSKAQPTDLQNLPQHLVIPLWED